MRNQCILALSPREGCPLNAMRCRLSVVVSLTDGGVSGAAGSLVCIALDRVVLTVSARDTGADKGLQGDKVPPNWPKSSLGSIVY